ncbi:ATP-binding protein [Catellatospora tritici]|uniref:ATP-binding protein n=1 Tax=Catellatospora tritici TaxID=2851566 RepID=UPI001C2D4B74|nr:ATP-binding protein [Catellatospora tritici]MBV1851241.1 ATP-binding protein [Catellatospora tritici]
MTFAVAGDLAGVRRFVRDRALAAGLATPRVEMLTLAVSELVSNTVEHSGGGGLVRVWAEAGAVVCEVLDQRPPGSRPTAFGGTAMPAADAIRGRGLAIVERVCDAVSLEVEGTSTLVRLRMAC